MVYRTISSLGLDRPRKGPAAATPTDFCAVCKFDLI
jgi:hypothetical protein